MKKVKIIIHVPTWKCKADLPVSGYQRAGFNGICGGRHHRARRRGLRGGQVGGTSPFGTRCALRVFVGASALEPPRILFNGGRRGYLVGIVPRVLVNVLRALAVHCAI